MIPQNMGFVYFFSYPSAISSRAERLSGLWNLTSRGGTLMPLPPSEISIDFSAKKR